MDSLVKVGEVVAGHDAGAGGAAAARGVVTGEREAERGERAAGRCSVIVEVLRGAGVQRDRAGGGIDGRR